MTEDTKVKVRRKPRPKYNPNNKEQASYKPKKKRWKKHHKKAKKNLAESLIELQAHFNDKYHVT